MKTFEIGKTYACSSACNQDCVWTFSVIRRTVKTVTFQDKYGDEKTCRINADVSSRRNAETVFPMGRYSMAPLLDADDECMSHEEAERIAQEEEEARQAAIAARYKAEKAEAAQLIERYSQQYPTTDGAPYVVIEWSEHPGLDEGLTLSVPAAERVLAQLDASRADRNQRENSGGYDKTSFTVHYLADNGEWDTYGGRYDLGDDDGGLIAHIRSFGEWLTTAPAIYGEAEENRRRGGEIVALADRLDKLCTVLPGRVLSFSDALKRKQSETAAAGALAAELLLDLISAAAKAETPAKPVHHEPGVIIPLF